MSRLTIWSICLLSVACSDSLKERGSGANEHVVSDSSFACDGHCDAGHTLPDDGLMDGGSVGSGTVDGDVSGHSLVIMDAITAVYSADRTMIVLSDREHSCDRLGSSTAPKNGTVLFLVLTPRANGALEPATYFVSRDDGGFSAATANFMQFSAQCQATLGASGIGAISGYVKIAEVRSNGSTTGSFDIQFPNGELRGGFDASACTIRSYSGTCD